MHFFLNRAIAIWVERNGKLASTKGVINVEQNLSFMCSRFFQQKVSGWVRMTPIFKHL
jgi:hypothetical protein